MKLDKTNACVFIESEAQLQEARELLERYNEPIDDIIFQRTEGEYFNYLRMYHDDTWGLLTMSLRNKITLSELEEILEGQCFITKFKDYRDLPFSKQIQDELFNRHDHTAYGEIVYSEKDVLILLQMIQKEILKGEKGE